MIRSDRYISPNPHLRALDEEAWLRGQALILGKLLMQKFGVTQEDVSGRLQGLNEEALDRFALKILTANTIEEVFSEDPGD